MVGVAGSIPVAPTNFLRFPPFTHAGIVARAPPPRINRATALQRCSLCSFLRSGRHVRADARTVGTARRRGRVTYFIAAPPTAVEIRPGDAELALWALESWQRAAGGALTFVRAASEDEALVRLYWAPAAGGQYGEMRPLEVDGRRGAAVYIRPDTAALGDEIAHERAARRSVSRHDRLPDVPARARPCARSRAHGRLRGRDVLLRLRRRHHRVLRPLPPHAAQRDDIRASSGLSRGDLEQLEALYGPGAAPGELTVAN